MADISADRYLEIYGESHIGRWVLDNSAAQTVYVGSPLMLDISEDTVYLRIFDSNVTPATGDVFVGFAAEGKVVATTDTEVDNIIDVYEAPTIVGVPKNSLTDADVGKDIYMSDSGTVTTTSASNLKIGRLHRVVGDFAFIEVYARIISA